MTDISDTTTVYIKTLRGDDVYINLEKGVVIGGGVVDTICNAARALKITNKFKLCDYPYVQMEEVRDGE